MNQKKGLILSIYSNRQAPRTPAAIERSSPLYGGDGFLRNLGYDAVTWVDAEPYAAGEVVLKPPPVCDADPGLAPAVVLVVDEIVGRRRIRCIPAKWYADSQHRWATFGGEFVATPDTRFRDALHEIGSDVWAVPLFDHLD